MLIKLGEVILINRMFIKLLNPRIVRRIYLERLGEPLIYNLVAIWFLIVGRFSKKIDYDLVPRQPYAFGALEAFKKAKEIGIKKITLIEFGVAAGAGLLNLIYICQKLRNEFGIDFTVIGFDSGEGMPPAKDYKDHPEKYKLGDFPMSDQKKLQSMLPENSKLYIGPIAKTVSNFFEDFKGSKSVIGFVSIDVDYYTSTNDCLEIFKGPPGSYLPACPVYLDDVNNIDHNPYCGELLAINEFNTNYSTHRKFAQMNQLRNWRIFKNALWLDQMYFYHVFDHELRNPRIYEKNPVAVLENPYI